MNLQQRTQAFVQLQAFLTRHFSERLPEEKVLHEGLDQLIATQQQYNAWFNPENVELALRNIAAMLEETELRRFASRLDDRAPKRVAVICAGNIPMVGFHDVLCVLLSGHQLLIKLSEDDRFLIPFFLRLLVHYAPGFEEKIRFVEGKLSEFDAVIATGSNNTSRHFDYYFAKYPRIVRRNRTSVAILNGDESPEELKALGKDIFSYFGLGCRNVSKVLVPAGYRFDPFFEAIYSFGEVVNNRKYGNNYDYHRALFLLDSIPFLDNNFLIIRQSEELFSPISVLHYQEFESETAKQDYLQANRGQLQCIVGKGHVSFGCSQSPVISDFADGVDTLEFLLHL